MHLALVGHELGSCEGQPRGDNPLNGGIVGKIEEETDVLHASVLLEVLLEEPGGLHVHSHGGEHDSKVVLGDNQGRCSFSYCQTKKRNLKKSIRMIFQKEKRFIK